MAIEVTLAISLGDLPAGQTTETTARFVADLGGRLVSWTPELNGAPAKAKFIFATEAGRDQFVAAALALAGISLLVAD
jgi:hypothetical protein